MSSREGQSVDSIFEKALEGSDVKRGNDILVLALHASLLSEGFDCISVREEGFESDQSESDALATPANPALPKGWNSSSDVYVLQYRQREKKERSCLIKVLPLGDLLLINAICSDRLSEIYNMSLPVRDYINEEVKSLTTISAVKNIVKLFSSLDKEVTANIKRYEKMPKIFEDLAKSSSGKDFFADMDEYDDNGDVISKPKPIGRNRREPQRMTGDHPPINLVEPLRGGVNPLGLGSNDLFPFGGPGGGGMIMDPLRERGRYGPGIGPSPPGFHPPGARFDPVSPFQPRFHPGQGGRGGLGGITDYGPDPDHLPPPGYDDMFS